MEKEKINNIEDFNPRPIVADNLIKYDFMDVANFNYLRPIRNTFSFQTKKQEIINDFIRDLKSVSSVAFGIDIKKLYVTKRFYTVMIVVSGEIEDTELWQKNVNRLYEFYKSL